MAAASGVEEESLIKGGIKILIGIALAIGLFWLGAKAIMNPEMIDGFGFEVMLVLFGIVALGYAVRQAYVIRLS